MKRFIVTILALTVLVGSVFAKSTYVKISCDNYKPQHIVRLIESYLDEDKPTTEEIEHLKITPATSFEKEIDPYNRFSDLHYRLELENVEIVYEQNNERKTVRMFDFTKREEHNDYVFEITLSSDYWMLEKNLQIGAAKVVEYRNVITIGEVY